MSKEDHRCAAYDCPWPPNMYVRWNPVYGHIVQDGTAAHNTHCWTHAQEVADRLNQGEAPQEITSTGQMALF